jgi:hypothetical protein
MIKLRAVRMGVTVEVRCEVLQVGTKGDALKASLRTLAR